MLALSEETGSEEKTNETPMDGDCGPQQISSAFLRLPREIRDELYKILFSSTRLAHGKKLIGRFGEGRYMKPAPHSLAILRTCRQIHDEAAPYWLSRVLFSFERPHDMVNKLSRLSFPILSQIRYVRTGAVPTVLHRFEYRGDGLHPHYRVDYGLAWILKMLPGLRLHRLTVLGPLNGALVFQSLWELVKHGDGWKELHFITRDSKVLMDYCRVSIDSDDEEAYGRMIILDGEVLRFRLETLYSILRKRDDEGPEPSIVVYRSIYPNAPGTVTDPCTRDVLAHSEPFEEDMVNCTTRNGIIGRMVDEETEDMMSEQQKVGKEVLITVSRGRDADITDQEKPPYSFHDIRYWAGDTPWDAIVSECRDPADNEHLSCWYDVDTFENYHGDDWIRSQDGVVEVDKYTDVDEYNWGPSR